MTDTSTGSAVVIEDDDDIRLLISAVLEQRGLQVRSAASGREGLALVEQHQPDLVTLDLGLPDIEGFEVCRRLRMISDAYVVMISASADEVDQLLGLEIGADDYITKPFSPKEVVARVRAVLRRFDQPLKKEIVRVGDIVIDTAAMRLTSRNEPVVTTATEFRLIEFLASHPGRVFTRKSLLDAVWHDTAFVTPRIVDVYIRRLREKIERDPEKPRHIHTVRGAGYMFEVRK